MQSWRRFATAFFSVCSVLGIIHLASFSAPVNMAVTNDCHGSKFGERSYLARIVGKTSFYVEKRCNFEFAIGCKGGFPLLQSFTLSPDEHFDCDAFPDAPRLTKFGLVYSDNGGIISHAWLFSLSRLTTFTLAMDGISSDALQILLENLHSIQELYFKASGYTYVPDIYPFPPRCLEHLRILEAPYPQILQVIKAPSLVELCLETDYELYPDDGYEMLDFYREVLEAFIEVSSCHLRKFILTEFTLEQAEPLINSFPDLEELCIDDLNGCPCELLGSFDKEPAFTVFPNLRFLTLTYEPYRTEAIVKALEGILEFRNGIYIGEQSIPLRPLEKIIIKHRRHAWSPIPYFL